MEGVLPLVVVVLVSAGLGDVEFVLSPEVGEVAFECDLQKKNMGIEKNKYNFVTLTVSKSRISFGRISSFVLT